MSNSNNKSIGLVILIILIILVFFSLIPKILFVPFHVLPQTIKHTIGMPFHFIDFPHPHKIFSFILVILWIAVIIWVYKDAERRNMNGLIWALLVFFGNVIGLLIYIIVRSDNLPSIASTIESNPCPECGKSVTEKYTYCPYCGTKLQAACPKCDKPIEPDWQVCPHCGKKLG